MQGKRQYWPTFDTTRRCAILGPNVCRLGFKVPHSPMSSIYVLTNGVFKEVLGACKKGSIPPPPPPPQAPPHPHQNNKTSITGTGANHLIARVTFRDTCTTDMRPSAFGTQRPPCLQLNGPNQKPQNPQGELLGLASLAEWMAQKKSKLFMCHQNGPTPKSSKFMNPGSEQGFLISLTSVSPTWRV